VEKNPVCELGPGLVGPFSRVGVSGADIIFESLLGPRVTEFVLARRWDIMFPDGDTTTFVLVVLAGSETPRSRGAEKRAEPGSVGVGGVLTIKGAGGSPFDGGVLGLDVVSSFAIRGLSGVGAGEAATACPACFSGNIAPILDATLPRLESAPPSFWNTPNVPPPALRSGLELRLEFDRLGLKASLSLPTGDVDLFGCVSLGVCRFPVVDGTADDSREASVPVERGKVDDLGKSSSSRRGSELAGTVEVFTRGEDDVR
jgi:hypothetical protein